MPGDPSTLLGGLFLAAEAGPAPAPAPAPAPGAGTGTPTGGGSGSGDQGGGGGLTQTLMMFGLIFFIFYFLVLRPQGKERKKREELLKGVKKFDRVVTTAGLHGRVVSVSDDTLVLEVTDGVRLKFDRSALWKVLSADEPADKSAAPLAEPSPSSGKGGKS